MENLAKRLADAMKSAGLSQSELARAASRPGHPVTQQNVQQLVTARNASSKHLPAIAEALGVSQDWLTRGGEPLRADHAAFAMAGVRAAAGRNADSERLPVLGMAECGPDGWSLWNGDIIDTIPRPSNLYGAPRAYAVYIVGDSMEPRYYSGELAYIHPGKPITIGAFVLVQIRPEHEGEAPKAVVKRLVKRTGNKIVLEQYNPPKKFDVRNEDIVTIHRVVGSGEF